MSETPPPPPSGGNPPPPWWTQNQAPPQGQSGFRVDETLGFLRRLRRARDGRVLGGVAAGLGRGLGIDPVVIRVVLAVLTFFGGMSALLYGAAWLLIPEEGKDRSVLEQHLGRRRNGTPDNAVVIGGVVLVALVLLSVPWWGLPWQAPVLLLLAVVGVLVLARRNVEAGGTGPGQSGDPATPGDPNAPTQPLATTQPNWPASPPAGPDDVTGVVAGTGSWRDATPAPASFWQHPDPLGLADEEPSTPSLPVTTEPPPLPAKRRSALFPATVATVVLAMGVLAAIDVGMDGGLGPAAYVATALAVVGGGLFVGTWYGRPRGLIAIGVLLTIALIPTTVAERVDMSHAPSDAVYLQPTSVAEIGTFQDISAGDFTLDLAAVPFTDKTNVSTRLDLGAGRLVVIVPDNVDVYLTSDVGFGSLRYFGTEEDGVDMSKTLRDLGLDGVEGGGRLELRLDVAFGEAEIVRVSEASMRPGAPAAPVEPIAPRGPAAPSAPAVPSAPAAPTPKVGR